MQFASHRHVKAKHSSTILSCTDKIKRRKKPTPSYIAYTLHTQQTSIYAIYLTTLDTSRHDRHTALLASIANIGREIIMKPRHPFKQTVPINTSIVGCRKKYTNFEILLPIPFEQLIVSNLNLCFSYTHLYSIHQYHIG